ncbi:lysosomal acid phosphatase [Trichonephila clavipes]|nr:lysosomal acid phosphatase [Trichonephila clavipes]
MWKYLILIILLCHFQKDKAQQESPNAGRELAYLQILTTNGFYAPLSLYAKDENTAEDWPEGLGLLPKMRYSKKRVKTVVVNLSIFMDDKMTNFMFGEL